MAYIITRGQSATEMYLLQTARAAGIATFGWCGKGYAHSDPSEYGVTVVTEYADPAETHRRCTYWCILSAMAVVISRGDPDTEWIRAFAHDNGKFLFEISCINDRPRLPRGNVAFFFRDGADRWLRNWINRVIGANPLHSSASTPRLSRPKPGRSKLHMSRTMGPFN